MSEFTQGMVIGSVSMLLYFWAKDWYAEHGSRTPSRSAFLLAFLAVVVMGFMRGLILAAASL